MIANKEIERLEKSAVNLTVTVKKEHTKEEYDKLLSKYAKTAHIKGFRKGKVPTTVLERKFGESIKMEAAQSIMEESLKTVFDEIEEKPLMYSVPELKEEFELEFDKDFKFTVKYDIYPEIKVGDYKTVEIEEAQVTIGKEDEQRELEAYQEQNSIVMEKEDAKIAKDHIVTIDYQEIGEDGAAITDTKREDFVFTVGTKYNIYELDDDILGMKVGEKKVVEKEFPEDFTNKDLAGQKKKIEVEVKVIKEKQLPEINDELAQDISEKYETLDDLKKDIKDRLKKTAESRIRQKKIDDFLKKTLELSEMDLPESMVNAELETSFRQMAQQYRMAPEQLEKMLSTQGGGKEKIYEEWRPNAEESLKMRLIVNKLIEDEKIEVNDEEVDERIKDLSEGQSMSFDEIKDYYAKNNMMDMLESDVKERKLFDKLFEELKVKKGKKVKYLDLIQGNQ